MIRSYIRPAIEEALRSLGVGASMLAPEAALELRTQLAQRYADSSDPRALHWNALTSYVALQHPEAWRWVDELIAGRAVSFFAHVDDEPSVFAIPRGASVAAILSECPGFEFYIADTKQSFLICENMHDYLFGAGVAASWVDSLRPRHDAWIASLRDDET